ncbi:MAG TPA: C69 family dipeptidase, partial [Myxococcota bacterium]|nr:C69 family dipeptidase [Myxococcota bacterium]
MPHGTTHSRTLAALAAATCLWIAPAAWACTNFLVTRGASADGSTMITYAADSHVLYGELYYTPAADHAPGELRDVIEWDTGKFLGRIPQIPHTYSAVGNINEHQVSVGETTFGGRPELKDPLGGIDYGTLMYIALERARTAREAIEVMTSLANEHGYASDGESFSIADPNEAWIMDMIGKGPGGHGAVWVAVRIPDGYVSAHANQSRIRTFPLRDSKNALYAKEVISFAREKGYFKGKDEDFSFQDAYQPMTFEGLRICEARVWSMFRRVAPKATPPEESVLGKAAYKPLPMWIKPERKLTPKDVMELMRDHFEGSSMDLSKGVGAGPYGLPYRWRPLYFKVGGKEYINERSTSTQQTGFSFVSQLRAQLPGPIGGVLWFGVDDTASTVYVPMYAGIRRAPHNFAVGTGAFQRFDWESAWWVFNWVANFTYSRYRDMIVDVQKVQRELEGDFLGRQAAVDAAALELYKRSPELARDYLTGYSAEAAARTVKRWRKLGEELLVKYVDGNVKDELGGLTQPGYPEEWLKRIATEDGETLLKRRLPGEVVEDTPLHVTGYFHSVEEVAPLKAQVPADFPWDKEKLVLLPGTDACGKPPRCCLAPKEDPATKKLHLVPPEG